MTSTTPARLATYALLAFAAPLFVGCATTGTDAPAENRVTNPQVTPTTTPPRIEVHGHRGARARFPENSRPAFEHALAVGVDVLEMDLVVTKDDRLVVAHDPVLKGHIAIHEAHTVHEDRCVIRNLTWAEVSALEVGTKLHPLFPEQTIGPTLRFLSLRDVFALVAASNHPAAATVQFNIETKGTPGRPSESPDAETFARLVVNEVRAAQMEERVVIQSFDSATLRVVRELEPKIRLSFLNADSRPDYVAVLRSLDVEILSPHQLWITAADVAAIQADGRRVIPWTVNTPEGWDAMIALGVDGIITDDPEALIQHLKAKGLR